MQKRPIILSILLTVDTPYQARDTVPGKTANNKHYAIAHTFSCPLAFFEKSQPQTTKEEEAITEITPHTTTQQQRFEERQPEERLAVAAYAMRYAMSLNHTQTPVIRDALRHVRCLCVVIESHTNTCVLLGVGCVRVEERCQTRDREGRRRAMRSLMGTEALLVWTVVGKNPSVGRSRQGSKKELHEQERAT